MEGFLGLDGWSQVPNDSISCHFNFGRKHMQKICDIKTNNLLSADPFFAYKDQDEPIKEMSKWVPTWKDWFRVSSFHDWIIGFHIVRGASDGLKDDAEWESQHAKVHEVNAGFDNSQTLTVNSNEPNTTMTESSLEPEDDAETDYGLRLLDPQLLDIFVRKTATTDCQWRIFERNDSMSGMLRRRELKYCHVLVMSEPVFRNGYHSHVELNSKISGLFEEWSVFEFMKRRHLVSTIRMTAPQLITQEKLDKIDPDKILIAGLNPTIRVDQSSVIVGDNQQLASDERSLDAMRRQQDSQSVVNSDWSSVEQMFVRLHDKEELAAMHPTQAVPYLNEFADRFERSCYECLGVPVGVQLNLNPYMRKQPGVSSSSGMAETAQTYSTANQIYIDAQRHHRSLKCTQAAYLLDYFSLREKERTMLLLQDKVSVSRWVRKHQGRKAKRAYSKIEAQRVMSKVVIELRVPGTPQDDKVLSLYREGFLTYETTKQYQSMNWNIPLSGFHTKPDIALPDLLGIPPPEKKTKKE